MPPGREVAASPTAVAAIAGVLQWHRASDVTAKTGTTDGFYRETSATVRQRQVEGRLTVEMAAAAFFAVAKFRGVVFGQLLDGGDDVSALEWDSREWSSQFTVHDRLFWLAAEACLEL